MAFDRQTMRVPAGMQTGAFLLRPIRESDAELDYAAVMESREYLQAWEQTGWPADDFTLEDNRRDLRRHERQHAEGEAFTFTVMSPDETRCLGCVYIFAVDAGMFERSNTASTGDDRWSDVSATVYLWARNSALASALDRALLDALGPWLAHEWGFSNHLFITNEQFGQQVAMFEAAGLRLRFRIDDPKASGAFLAYGDGRSDPAG